MKEDKELTIWIGQTLIATCSPPRVLIIYIVYTSLQTLLLVITILILVPEVVSAYEGPFLVSRSARVWLRETRPFYTPVYGVARTACLTSAIQYHSKPCYYTY